MADRYVMRKQFTDRVFESGELADFAEMLRHWYLAHAGGAGNAGRVWCEAIVYAFARREGEGIRHAIASRVPSAAFDASDPDELRVTGPAISANNPADLSAWRAALAEPRLANACLVLRITFAGPTKSFNGSPSEGTATFVLCGAPAGGAMLVKALWRLGHDQSMEPVFRKAPDPLEAGLLEAFEVFLGQKGIAPADTAASLALWQFRKKHHTPFRSRDDERRIMAITRRRAELPDDRGPRGLLRRLGLPLGSCVGLLLIAFLAIGDPAAFVLLLIAAGYAGYLAGRIAWAKFKRVRQYYQRMRQGLGALHSAPVHYQLIDLAQDKTPTLLKHSADLLALGARHACDVSIISAKGVYDGNRVYALGDVAAAVGLLRKTESYQFFPARPVLMFQTRFEDGRRHVTLNRPKYRRQSRPEVTARCMLKEGGAEAVLGLHRWHVDRLVARGAVPLPAATTPEQVLKLREQDNEDSREAWKRCPYSWGDAFHDAFKICRREYLAD